MIKHYNKLIRDNIPQIIKKDGEEPVIKRLDDNEFILELFRKAHEEIGEAQEARDNKKELIKEIGDVYEVIDAIIDFYNLDTSEIKSVQKKRKKERGAFNKKLFLESIKQPKFESE